MGLEDITKISFTSPQRRSFTPTFSEGVNIEITSSDAPFKILSPSYSSCVDNISSDYPPLNFPLNNYPSVNNFRPNHYRVLKTPHASPPISPHNFPHNFIHSFPQNFPQNNPQNFLQNFPQIFPQNNPPLNHSPHKCPLSPNLLSLPLVHKIDPLQFGAFLAPLSKIRPQNSPPSGRENAGRETAGRIMEFAEKSETGPIERINGFYYSDDEMAFAERGAESADKMPLQLNTAHLPNRIIHLHDPKSKEEFSRQICVTQQSYPNPYETRQTSVGIHPQSNGYTRSSSDRWAGNLNNTRENSGKIEKNSEKIEKNSEKIEKKSEKIENNSQKIENDSQKIENYSPKIETNPQKIGNNYEKIENNFEKKQENRELTEGGTIANNYPPIDEIGRKAIEKMWEKHENIGEFAENPRNNSSPTDQHVQIYPHNVDLHDWELSPNELGGVHTDVSQFNVSTVAYEEIECVENIGTTAGFDDYFQASGADYFLGGEVTESAALEDGGDSRSECHMSEKKRQTVENGVKTIYICEKTLEIGGKTSEIDANTLEIDEQTSENGDKTLEIAETSLEFDANTLEIGDKTLANGEKPLDIDENTLEVDENTLEIKEHTLENGGKTLESDQNTLEMGEKTLENGEQTLGSDQNTLEMGEKTLENSENTSEIEENTSDNGEKTLETCRRRSHSADKPVGEEARKNRGDAGENGLRENCVRHPAELCGEKVEKLWKHDVCEEMDELIAKTEEMRKVNILLKCEYDDGSKLFVTRAGGTDVLSSAQMRYPCLEDFVCVSEARLGKPGDKRGEEWPKMVEKKIGEISENNFCEAGPGLRDELWDFYWEKTNGAKIYHQNDNLTKIRPHKYPLDNNPPKFHSEEVLTPSFFNSYDGGSFEAAHPPIGTLTPTSQKSEKKTEISRKEKPQKHLQFHTYPLTKNAHPLGYVSDTGAGRNAREKDENEKINTKILQEIYEKKTKIYKQEFEKVQRLINYLTSELATEKETKMQLYSQVNHLNKKMNNLEKDVQKKSDEIDNLEEEIFSLQKTASKALKYNRYKDRNEQLLEKIEVLQNSQNSFGGTQDFEYNLECKRTVCDLWGEGDFDRVAPVQWGENRPKNAVEMVEKYVKVQKIRKKVRNFDSPRFILWKGRSAQPEKKTITKSKKRQKMEKSENLTKVFASPTKKGETFELYREALLEVDIFDECGLNSPKKEENSVKINKNSAQIVENKLKMVEEIAVPLDGNGQQLVKMAVSWDFDHLYGVKNYDIYEKNHKFQLPSLNLFDEVVASLPALCDRDSRQFNFEPPFEKRARKMKQIRKKIRKIRLKSRPKVYLKPISPEYQTFQRSEKSQDNKSPKDQLCEFEKKDVIPSPPESTTFISYFAELAILEKFEYSDSDENTERMTTRRLAVSRYDHVLTHAVKGDGGFGGEMGGCKKFGGNTQQKTEKMTENNKKTVEKKDKMRALYHVTNCTAENILTGNNQEIAENPETMQDNIGGQEKGGHYENIFNFEDSIWTEEDVMSNYISGEGWEKMYLSCLPPPPELCHLERVHMAYEDLRSACVLKRGEESGTNVRKEGVKYGENWDFNSIKIDENYEYSLVIPHFTGNSCHPPHSPTESSFNSATAEAQYGGPEERRGEWETKGSPGRNITPSIDSSTIVTSSCTQTTPHTNRTDSLSETELMVYLTETDWIMLRELQHRSPAPSNEEMGTLIENLKKNNCSMGNTAQQITPTLEKIRFVRKIQNRTIAVQTRLSSEKIEIINSDEKSQKHPISPKSSPKSPQHVLLLDNQICDCGCGETFCAKLKRMLSRVEHKQGEGRKNCNAKPPPPCKNFWSWLVCSISRLFHPTRNARSKTGTNEETKKVDKPPKKYEKIVKNIDKTSQSDTDAINLHGPHTHDVTNDEKAKINGTQNFEKIDNIGVKMCEKMHTTGGKVCEKMDTTGGKMCENVKNNGVKMCEKVHNNGETICERIKNNGGKICEQIENNCEKICEQIDINGQNEQPNIRPNGRNMPVSIINGNNFDYNLSQPNDSQYDLQTDRVSNYLQPNFKPMRYGYHPPLDTITENLRENSPYLTNSSQSNLYYSYGTYLKLNSLEGDPPRQDSGKNRKNEAENFDQNCQNKTDIRTSRMPHIPRPNALLESIPNIIKEYNHKNTHKNSQKRNAQQKNYHNLSPPSMSTAPNFQTPFYCAENYSEKFRAENYAQKTQDLTQVDWVAKNVCYSSGYSKGSKHLGHNGAELFVPDILCGANQMNYDDFQNLQDMNLSPAERFPSAENLSPLKKNKKKWSNMFNKS